MKKSGGAANSELRLAECNSNAEWNIAKYFRQRYFFDKAGIQDPYTWTFNHKDHKHFVVYQNGEIIGYAHVQLYAMVTPTISTDLPSWVTARNMPEPEVSKKYEISIQNIKSDKLICQGPIALYKTFYSHVIKQSNL